jgi:hypothetical protein
VPGVIDRQIDSLHTSAAEAAADSGTQTPGRCRELDDLLAVAVALHERTKESVQAWQTSITDWEAAGWIEQARSFEARYRKLHDAFDRIARALADSQAQGCRPETADRFRRAKLDLDLLCQLSVDRMLRSDDSLRQGRGRTMAEVRDELRRRRNCLQSTGW